MHQSVLEEHSQQMQLPQSVVHVRSCRGSYLDSAASECYVPLAMSLDLASNDRPDGIQYRAGLHQVCLYPCTSDPQLCLARCSFGCRMGRSTGALLALLAVPLVPGSEQIL